MSAYRETLELLQEAMLDSQPLAINLHLKNTRPALAQRVNIYIEGYRIRLVKAVLSDYPAVINVLGARVAEELAQNYVECTNSESYTLDAYPIGFAEYLADNCDNGFAVAIAMLESAIAEVFWLPDSTAFMPPATLTADNLMGFCFVQRAASKLITLQYPVEEYLAAFREKCEVALPEPHKSYMFVVRHNNEVKRHVLSDAEYLVLSGLLSGAAVGNVLEDMIAQYPTLTEDIEQNLQNYFASWILNGFFQNNTGGKNV